MKTTAIIDDITRKINGEELEAGVKLPSQHKLCEIYKVSRMSIHNTFNELEKMGLIERKPGKGVFVKTRTPSRELKSAAVILPARQSLEPRACNNFGLELFWGIEEGLRENGAACQLRSIAKEERPRLASICGEMKVDGIILARTFFDAEVDEVVKLGVPVVMAGRVPDNPDCGGVGLNILDYYSGLLSILESEGCENVTILSRKSFFCGPDFMTLGASYTGKMNVEEIDYMRDEAFTPDDKQHIRAAVQNIIDEKRLPDALIGCSDWVIHWALEVLEKNGLSSPGDVKMIGCLGLQLPQRKTSITTFNADGGDIGRRSVDVLRRMVESGLNRLIERAPLRFVERETYRRKNEQQD